MVGGWFARRWLVDARCGKTNERSAFLFLHYDRWRLSLQHLKVRLKQKDELTFLTVDKIFQLSMYPTGREKYEVGRYKTNILKYFIS